jgi:tripartite-type tricarboxylate transporter receptor subunit TctC
VSDLIALARARAGALSYATSAVGGAPHLAAALFEDLAGVSMRHVRYDRTEHLYDDLVAGRVDLSFNTVMSMLPRLRSGTLRGLAVTGTTPSAAAPGLPTIAQAGLPGYEMTNWVGIVAPRGTASGIVMRLAAAVAAAAQSPSLVRAWAEAGIDSPKGTPDDFAAFISREIERWLPIGARLRRS